jgi:lipoate-protein ligase A
MTQVKIAGKASTVAAEALGRHAAALYATPGKRIVGVVELVHVLRTQPAPDEDKEPSVELRIQQLEIGEADQEDVLRQAIRALNIARTAQGTLTEEGDIELSDRTLEMTADRLSDLEASRLVVACHHWADYARRILSVKKLTTSEARHEFEIIAAGLMAATGHRPQAD